MGSIRVTNLGKAYKHYPSRWSRLAEWLLPGVGPRHQLTWVLRDINFEVVPGQAIGVVGVNGAGKSTLLKLITGTNLPTTGAIHLTGRVAALLELGMGFHPDFTGRQNVMMAGQLLGMSVAEVNGLMDQIQDFAQIGEYIDQPVRVYSSGMQVRLAFSVATAVRPDILIVDEALAVGDAAFQRKCFRRIESFRSDGTTLLLVSHDIEAVKRLCDQALFLHGGRLEAAGTAKEVCDAYEEKLFGKRSIAPTATSSPAATPAVLDPSLITGPVETLYGDGGADISGVAIHEAAGGPVNVVPESLAFSINYRVAFAAPAQGVQFGMMIKSTDGVCVYATNTEKWQLREQYAPGDTVDVKFELQGNLVPGTYFLNVGVTHIQDGEPRFLQRRVDCLIFRVVAAHWRTTLGYANMFAVPSLRAAGAHS